MQGPCRTAAPAVSTGSRTPLAALRIHLSASALCGSDRTEPPLSVEHSSILVPGTRAGSYTESWRLAWPTVVGQLAVTVMWTADTIMLGQVGKVELAAAGFGGVLIWTLYTFFVGLTNATNTFVSQAAGRRERSECAVYAWQGLWLSAVGACFLFLALWKFEWIMALARPEPEVAAECTRYAQARLSGCFFVLGTFTLQAFFRGIGDVKTPMRVAVLANGLNIVLDAVLIFGLGPFPRLTTLGAGIATALAQAASFIVLLALFLGPTIQARYRSRSAWRPLRVPLSRMLRVGTPMGVQFFGDMGSFSVFMALMGRLGTNELAATQIGIQVLSFSFMPASGMARAATTLVGNYLGAGQRALALASGWTAIKLTVAYTLAAGVVCLLLQDHLFWLFNRDPEVIAAGVAVLPALVLFQVFDGAQSCAGGALQGAGDTAVPMAVFLGSSWLVFVPLSLLFARQWGMTGAWYAPVVHFGLVSAVLVTRYGRGGWQSRVIA